MYRQDVRGAAGAAVERGGSMKFGRGGWVGVGVAGGVAKRFKRAAVGEVIVTR